MNDTPAKVLISNAVRHFLSWGGQLGLKGAEDARGRLHWVVVARGQDGVVYDVLESRTGKPRRLLTPSAAFRYVARYHPEAESICLPLKKGGICFAG